LFALCKSPGKACERSGLMLARVLPGGVLELLSPAAWARVLGFSTQELSGKWLHDLMPLDQPAASEVTAALLGEQDSPPMEVTLRCKDERRKSFRLHRRRDTYDRAVFVLADEVA
jgi:PAS domain-containing protein